MKDDTQYGNKLSSETFGLAFCCIFAVFLLHFRRILPAEKFVKIP